jgi:Xaa-Pro aminopeptidase
VSVIAERILTRISDDELERRWNAIRNIMRHRQIDALVLQGTNDWLGGYVRWFTDLPATNGYPRTVIFHANDSMSVVEMGRTGETRHLEGDELHRGVGKLLLTPSFLSINYTHEYDADCVVSELKPRSYQRIGLIGEGALPHAFVARIKSGLRGTEFVDATAHIDHIKAIKSPEEIALIRRTADMQDRILDAVLSYIRPGIRDVDVATFAQQEGQRLGSEQGIFLGGSARIGRPSTFVPRYMQGRTLGAGDHISLLIENNGPGGFYTEIARTVVLGKASNELNDGFESMREAQQHTLGLLKPGIPCREVYLAHNAYMERQGLPPELRLYAHGQGYDMVERPLIRSDETMAIEAGMNLAVHPGYETESMFAVICDNYIIGENGPGDCLHKTEKRIFELDL